MRILHFMLLRILCLLVSCDKQIKSVIANTEIVSDSITVDNRKEAFRISYSTWKNKTELKYYIDYPPVNKNGVEIVDYFNKSDKNYIQLKTLEAVNEWNPCFRFSILETNKKELADFIIIWKFLENDGRGGDLASADFPPVSGQTRKPRIVMDLADMWQIVKDRDTKKYKYYNVVLHELGHIVAGLSHDDSRGVMNTFFNFNHLQIDDIAGARINYNNFKDFNLNGVTYRFISKTSTKNITTNFKEKEFLSKCSHNSDKGHFLSLSSITAIQYIRTHYNTPIWIISTFRNKACNNAAGGSSMSQHLERNAIDWKFVGKNAAKTQIRFEYDIKTKTKVLSNLLNYGITGYGTYPYGYGTNHIDSRTYLAHNRTAFGKYYTVWGEFNKGGSWYDYNLEYKIYD